MENLIMADFVSLATDLLNGVQARSEVEEVETRFERVLHGDFGATFHGTVPEYGAKSG